MPSSTWKSSTHDRDREGEIDINDDFTNQEYRTHCFLSALMNALTHVFQTL